MNLVYLSIGSNLGDRLSNIQTSISLICEKIGSLVSCSSLYETEPIGFESNFLFYNCCLAVQTTMSAMEILMFTQKFEKEMGRLPSNGKSYESRIIDIDLIFYNKEVINNPNLKIPHPRYSSRAFVLEPLCEIAPDYRDPLTGKTIQELNNFLSENLMKMDSKKIKFIPINNFVIEKVSMS